jgi:streptomycin 6-kinase
VTERFSIPDRLAVSLSALRGAAGVEWSRGLPAILADCEHRWSLTIGPPFEGVWYNYVAPARRADGTSVVVKVCYPDNDFVAEAEALRLCGGMGAVQLLDVERDQGAMLLENITPGTMLRTVQDDAEATSIAASVMRQIWRPVPDEHPFPTVGDWGKGLAKLRAQFGGGTGPFPRKLVEEGESLFAELLASMGEPVVLHGDLHHHNILSAERQPWLAIDPKGVVGEAEYEVGALLRNPMPDIPTWPNLERVLARRMDQLAEELGFDRERIQGWAVAQAVLSAWWSYEISDGELDEDAKAFIGLSEALSRVR